MPVDASTSSPLGPSDFEDPREYQLWAMAMLLGYQAHADASYAKAEGLAAQAVKMREDGNAALERARAISGELARFLDSK